MLNTLRHAAKSWVAKVLILLLIASFAVWGIGDMFSFRLDDSVAEVGDTSVSANRFANALRREQSRLSQQAGELVGFPVIQQLGIDRRVLAGLVRDAAFAEELDRLGLAAPDKAVAKAIREEPAFQGPGGSFSDQAYRLLLAQQGMSPGEFEAFTRQVVAREILTGAVGGVISQPPGAATRIAAYRGETRDIAQLALPLELADAPEPPDEDALRAFYEAAPERYTQPERRTGRYIHIDLAALADRLAPDEEAIAAAYETQKDAFAARPTRTIDRIAFASEEEARVAAELIEQGKSTFEEIAAQRGATEDMDLGTVGPDDLPEVTSGPVFAATETGVIGPVPTPLGSALIRIREVTEGGVRPLAEVRDRIAARLASDAALQRAPEIANLIEEGRAAGKSLEEIAGEVDLPLGSFDGLARDGSLAAGGSASGFVASDGFEQEVFEAFAQEERDIIETPEGGYLLVMVDRIAESALPPFEEVRDQVLEDWTADARLTALEERAAELTARLEDGETTIEALAGELELAASSFNGVDRFRDDAQLPGPLVEKLFSAEKGGAAFARAADGSGVVLAQVTAVRPLPPERLGAEASNIEEVLQQSLSFDMLEYFGRALEREHGAVVDQNVLGEVYRLVSGNTGN